VGVPKPNRLALALVACACWVATPTTAADPKEAHARISGTVRATESFTAPFGPDFRFTLSPTPWGWFLSIRGRGGPEDMARCTPPFHFVPNPREIEGWHFRNADNTGPNDAGPKNVNAPQEVREFVFAPALAATQADLASTCGERFGRGVLRIEAFELSPLQPGERARFESLKFAVELWWPDEYD
jgi:hypothetical protein